jgi:hypothetical protein
VRLGVLGSMDMVLSQDGLWNCHFWVSSLCLEGVLRIICGTRFEWVDGMFGLALVGWRV